MNTAVGAPMISAGKFVGRPPIFGIEAEDKSRQASESEILPGAGAASNCFMHIIQEDNSPLNDSRIDLRPRISEAREMMRIFLCLSIFIFATAAYADAESAIAEFKNGQTTRFSTTGHAKAKGASFSIKYPNSWKAKEGDRPNIIQKFQSDDGKGREFLSFTVRTFPNLGDALPKESDMQQFFAPAAVKEMIEQDRKGWTFLGAEKTKIDGQLAGFADTFTQQESAGIKIGLRALEITFFDGNKMVSVMCSIAGMPNETADDLEKRMAEFRPLFLLMANSIVVDGRWKQ